MNKCAVCRVRDNVVVNIIVAHPTDPVSPDFKLVEILEGTVCNLDWVYDGVMFLNPEFILENNFTTTSGAVSGSNT